MKPIQYQIKPENVNSHLFSVTMSFDVNPQQNYTLSLPAWLPGSYMIRDFAKKLINPQCQNAHGETVELKRVDKQTWQVESEQATRLTIAYQVFAFDLSVRTAYLDNQRGFFNGSSTFLSVEELADMPCQLTILAPDNLPAWRVATGMPRASDTARYQFGDYLADNYHHLIDCPVALGDFDVTEFEVNNVPHFMVFTSEHYGDRERMVKDLTKLCQHHMDLFGETPFDEYWFITHLQAQGFGGLEHKNSTILQAGRFDLANPQQPEVMSESYQTFLSLCSHEYFHAWNVCRLKPKEFVPFDLSKECYTEQLWAYEGITSYYDDMSLVRAGVIEIEAYLKVLSKTATRVYRGAGESRQSIVESSFYTWNKFYQQGPEAPNHIVSYYTKGSLFALWLDLTIREKSQGKKSLDDLMRYMWQNFGKDESGTTTQDYLDCFNQLCQEDLSQQFHQMLNAKASYELTPLLDNVGVKFERAQMAKLNSLDVEVSSSFKPYLGAMYKATPQGLQITSVIEHSPAANAGLAVNDVLIAINEMKVTEKSLNAILSHLPQGSEMSCHYFRDDQLISATLMLTNAPEAGVLLTLIEQDKAKAWLTAT